MAHNPIAGSYTDPDTCCEDVAEARRLVARMFMRSAPFVTGHLGFWEGMGDVSLDAAWDKAKDWLDQHPEPKGGSDDRNTA